MQVPSLDPEDPLEEGMATHSSIIVWRIPWTEKPGGPQSAGHRSRTQLKQLSTAEYSRLVTSFNDSVSYLFALTLKSEYKIPKCQTSKSTH